MKYFFTNRTPLGGLTRFVFFLIATLLLIVVELLIIQHYVSGITEMVCLGICIMLNIALCFVAETVGVAYYSSKKD